MSRVGHQAAVQKGTLRKEDQDSLPRECAEAVVSMQRYGFLVKGQSGSLHLTSAASISTVDIKSPVLVSKLYEGELPTVYETRQRLIRQGWSTTDNLRECSIGSHVMLRKQCLEYFLLLWRYEESLQRLASQNAFSHGQGAAYYDCVVEVCKKDPFVRHLATSSSDDNFLRLRAVIKFNELQI